MVTRTESPISPELKMFFMRVDNYEKVVVLSAIRERGATKNRIRFEDGTEKVVMNDLLVSEQTFTVRFRGKDNQIKDVEVKDVTKLRAQRQALEIVGRGWAVEQCIEEGESFRPEVNVTINPDNTSGKYIFPVKGLKGLDGFVKNAIRQKLPGDVVYIVVEGRRFKMEE